MATTFKDVDIPPFIKDAVDEIKSKGMPTLAILA